MQKWVGKAKNKEFEQAAYFLWVGNAAIHIWDRKNKWKERIAFAAADSGAIPGIPKFHYIYDDIVYYEKQAEKIFKRKFFSRRYVCIAVPDDISWIEQRALSDFGYRITKIAQLFLYSHSMALCSYSAFKEHDMDCIVVTQGCRCYCITLMRNGKAEERRFLEIYRTGREELLQAVRGIAGKPLRVYCSGVEKNDIFHGMGTEVSFDDL